MGRLINRISSLNVDECDVKVDNEMYVQSGRIVKNSRCNDINFFLRDFFSIGEGYFTYGG